MIDLTRANKIMTDKEILEKFAELFKKYINENSRLEVIDQMSKDFMNAFIIVGYIIGQDEAYIKGYLKASFRKEMMEK